MNRRHFIKGLGATLVVFQADISAKNVGLLSKPSGDSSKKIIWIVLRGAVDSLHAVVPTFEPAIAKMRPKLYSDVKDKLVPLNSKYGMHAKLKHMHTLFKSKELSPIIAVGSGYKKRSHFDGQDFLESGTGYVGTDSGWLSRAINIKRKQGLAIARSIPVSLRGQSNSSTWYPSKLKVAPDDIYDQLKKLYENDEMLLKRLEEGLSVQSMTGMDPRKRQGKFKDLAKSCGNLIKKNSEIDCAMLEMGGWDTHNNQNARLNKQFQQLDDGLFELKNALGTTWDDTVVIVATEFGRTVRENGTGGTDHGTASAMFLAGGDLSHLSGAIEPGKVLGKWPGLSDTELFKNRDLMPTSNSYSWIAEVLKSHWGLSEKEILTVFPHIA